MLSTVIHEKVENMAVVFRLDLHSESRMMMSTRVNRAILDGFGVTADQIKQDPLRQLRNDTGSENSNRNDRLHSFRHKESAV